MPVGEGDGPLPHRQQGGGTEEEKLRKAETELKDANDKLKAKTDSLQARASEGWQPPCP